MFFTTVREMKVRAAVAVGYFAVCSAGLFYYTYGSSFSSRAGESGNLAQTLHLSIACTLWEVFVSFCGGLTAKKFRLAANSAGAQHRIGAGWFRLASVLEL
jgi:hypothetical protein